MIIAMSRINKVRVVRDIAYTPAAPETDARVSRGAALRELTPAAVSTDDTIADDAAAVRQPPAERRPVSDDGIVLDGALTQQESAAVHLRRVADDEVVSNGAAATE